MAKRRSKPKDFFVCPHCGARVRAGSKFCRECGASDDSGWGEDEGAWADGAPSGYGPDDDFDYEEFVAREFPDHAPSPSARRLKRRAMAALVAIVVAAFLASVLSRFLG